MAEGHCRKRLLRMTLNGWVKFTDKKSHLEDKIVMVTSFLSSSNHNYLR
jgi:hypothetical protein